MNFKILYVIRNLLWDHLEDHIVQSNQQLVYQDHVQLHQYREEYQKKHYKIGKMLLFSLSVFVFPIK